jgi:hypothetical protein
MNVGAMYLDLLGEGRSWRAPLGRETDRLRDFMGKCVSKGVKPVRFCGLALDAAGCFYVTCSNHTIWKVMPDGTVGWLAGKAGRKGDRDGIGTRVRFCHPGDLALDDLGNIYMLDGDNYAIRRIDLTGLVTAFAGIPGAHRYLDGPRTTATFRRLTGCSLTANRIFSSRMAIRFARSTSMAWLQLSLAIRTSTICPTNPGASGLLQSGRDGNRQQKQSVSFGQQPSPHLQYDT